MSITYTQYLEDEIVALKEAGLFKEEKTITSKQSSHIEVVGAVSDDIINLCSNNYLGLANHPQIIEAAHESLEDFGNGMASVRFICGTQMPHKRLEDRLSQFLGMEDTILYSSCYSATLGLFGALMGPEDAILSDSLNHACLIDGIRLSRAEKHVYAHSNMVDLEEKLQQTQGARFRLIATDGVFSMDGYLANLPEICRLAETYDAMVMVDDSHGVGVIGPSGRGTPAYFDLQDRVHILTGTLGKALGGSAGGYVSAQKTVVEWLRQKSRTYLFSNSLPPTLCAGSIRALDVVEEGGSLFEKLQENTKYFRHEMEALGFNLLPGSHPIIPVMLGDAKLAKLMADQLYDEGIYVVGFSFPVVPMDEARIRVQISAAHSREDLERAVFAFACVGRRLRVI